MKKFAPLFCALALLSSSAHALNKDALAQHLRESLGLDSRTPVAITGDPKPSGVGNLNVIQANIGGGNYPVYISPDEKSYLWGQMNDLTQSPDERNVRAMNESLGHSMGSKTAPVTVVEYSDMECGFCKKAHDIIKKELYKNYTKDQVRLVYKHYPLNMHFWAEDAAIATECAAEQKEASFWDMQDLIFKNAPSLSSGTINTALMGYAKSLNLNTGAFTTCMDDPKIQQRVQESKKEAGALGVNSTPTLFINGRIRRGFRDFSDLQVVIDEKLKKKK